MEPIDFSGLKMIVDDDLSTIPLQGAYGPEELARHFIYNWLTLRDCRECGRPERCRYGLDPDEVDRRSKPDEPCAAVAALIRNHVRVTYHVLESLNRAEIQSYLNATYHFVRWIDQVELNTASYMNDALLEWMGDEASATVIAGYTRLRAHLDEAAGLMTSIPAFRTRRGVLLVEGESEKAFLNEMRKSHRRRFLYLDVLAYRGVSKRSSAKLELFIRQQISTGYEVFLQGDCDGKEAKWLDDLDAKGLVKKEHVFPFQWDLETSVPPALLFDILVELHLLGSEKRDEFLDKTDRRDQSVGRLLKDAFGIHIDNHKVSIARKLGAIIAVCGWKYDPVIEESELAKFLTFVDTIP